MAYLDDNGNEVAEDQYLDDNGEPISAQPITEPSTNTKPKAEPGFVEGLVEHSPIGLLKQTGTEIGQAIKHPTSVLGNIPLLVAPGTSFNSLKSGYEAAKTGNGLDMLKSLAPGLSGIVSTGEALAKPETRNYGYGAALGELSNIALAKYAPKAFKSSVEAIGKSAPKSWVAGINPKASVSGLAERIAPEALERKVGGTAGSMQAMVENRLPEANIALDKAWENTPQDTPINVGPVRSAIQEEVAARTFGGAVQPGAQAEVNALQKQLQFIDEASGGTNNVPAAIARRLRQSWDNDINWLRNAKRTSDLVTPEQAAPAMAAEAAANAFRRSIAETIPETIGPGKDVSFYSNLEKVLQNRRMPSNKFVTVLGGLAGAGEGIKGVGKGALSARLLYGLADTPAWKTMSAIQKARLAKMLGYVPPAKFTGRPPVADSFKLDLQNEQVPISDSVKPSGNLWGGDVPEEFMPREALTPNEALAEREFLRPNLEAGTNAEQARMARRYLEQHKYDRAQQALDEQGGASASDFTSPEPNLSYESPVQLLDEPIPSQLEALLAEDARAADIAQRIAEMLRQTRGMKTDYINNIPSKLGPVER